MSKCASGIVARYRLRPTPIKILSGNGGRVLSAASEAVDASFLCSRVEEGATPSDPRSRRALDPHEVLQPIIPRGNIVTR